MRTKARLLSMLLALSCLLTVFAAAAPAGGSSGLNNFPDIKTYQSGQFTDVPSGSWFENSVKTVYQKGLMEGIGEGLFDPYKVIPWTQAVTLAARLHSTYNGSEIPDSEGPWYAKYMSYAEKAGILPSTCPEAGEADTTPITRQELAGLFCNILSSEDLPNINDISIPDIDQVSPEFADSAKAMYAAGIFTGKGGNQFDPNGQAQRAEIATLMSRLLYPGTRIGQDSKANQAMVDQYGNFANGGWVVQGNGIDYCIAREIIGTGANIKKVYSIITRTADGSCSEIYSTENSIQHLSMDSTGLLYFTEMGFDENGQSNLEALISYDPQTHDTKTLYQVSDPKESGIESYILYDGEIYIWESDTTSNDTVNWKYTFGRLENGKLKSLFSTKYELALYTIQSTHIFNGKAYFLYGTEKHAGQVITYYDDAVWSLDLKTGKTEQVTDLVYSSFAAFNDATCWYATATKDQKTIYLKRINLLCPDIVESVMTFPQEFMGAGWNLYANGNTLYYHNYSAQKVWQISDSGDYTQAGTMRAGRYYNSQATNQGVVSQQFDWMDLCSSVGSHVSLPDGKMIAYDDFTNKPSLYIGSGLFELTQVTNYEPSFAEDDISNCQFRMGLRADGDLVIESTAKNNSDGNRIIRYYCLNLTGAGLNIQRSFDHNWENVLSAGESRDFTIVIPKELLNGANPDNLEVELTMLVTTL